MIEYITSNTGESINRAMTTEERLKKTIYRNRMWPLTIALKALKYIYVNIPSEVYTDEDLEDMQALAGVR